MWWAYSAPTPSPLIGIGLIYLPQYSWDKPPCPCVFWSTSYDYTFYSKVKIQVRKVMDFNIFYLRARDALTSLASEAKAEPRTPGFIKPKKKFWK